MLLGAVPDGDGPLGLALVVDDVDEDAVDSHGISAEQHLLGVEAEPRIVRERSAMPDAD